MVGIVVGPLPESREGYWSFLTIWCDPSQSTAIFCWRVWHPATWVATSSSNQNVPPTCGVPRPRAASLSRGRRLGSLPSPSLSLSGTGSWPQRSTWATPKRLHCTPRPPPLIACRCSTHLIQSTLYCLYCCVSALYLTSITIRYNPRRLELEERMDGSGSGSGSAVKSFLDSTLYLAICEPTPSLNLTPPIVGWGWPFFICFAS